jgi:ABC-type glycerol-3-phosphate transport system substrate-binding protein
MARRVCAILVCLALAGGTLFAGSTQETDKPAAATKAAGGAYVPAKELTLRFQYSYSGYRAELLKSYVAEWEKANPMIRIKLEYGGDLYTMRDKLLTAIAGGAAPDIAEIDSYWTPIFAQPGAIVNLEPYMADPAYNKPDLQAPALLSTQYKGQSYSIPFNLDTIVMYYNKGLFKAAGLDPNKGPATWQEIEDFGKKLTVDKNGDGTPDQWGIVFPTQANFGAVWYWLAFFAQQGGKLFNDATTEGTFNSEAGVAATNFWRKLVYEDKILTLSAGWGDFEAGIAAMELTSSAELGGYKDSMGANNIGIVPLPRGKVSATVTGGGNLAILSACPDKKAAWAFLSWLGSTEINKRWTLATGAIPIRKSVIATAEYQDFLIRDPFAKTMLSTLDTAFVRPNVPQYGDASRILALAVEESVFKNTDPKPLLDKAKAEVDKLFK